jgi:hypothetical protein
MSIRITRRSFSQLLSIGVWHMFASDRSAQSQLLPAADAVDHIILGVRDLEAGMEWFARQTGVRPAVGGVHPGRGTRNALVGLEGRRYIEILAPDPAQAAPRADLLALDAPRLVGWAVAAGMADLAKRITASGLTAAGPRPGSRARPDGRTLEWTTLAVASDFAANGVDPMPFFIEWGASSVHPSQDSPAGCSLTSFELEHPEPGRLTKALEQVGVEAVVREAARPGLIAVLKTPAGPLRLA